jgi:hypothetical protein
VRVELPAFAILGNTKIAGDEDERPREAVGDVGCGDLVEVVLRHARLDQKALGDKARDYEKEPKVMTVGCQRREERRGSRVAQ